MGKSQGNFKVLLRIRLFGLLVFSMYLFSLDMEIVYIIMISALASKIIHLWKGRKIKSPATCETKLFDESLALGYC